MICIFDIDGTIALNHHRQHYLQESPSNWKAWNESCSKDDPNLPVLEVLYSLHDAGNMIFLLSGRSEDMKFDTIEWLQSVALVPDWDGLYMRSKVDSRDDTIVKKELYFQLIRDLHKKYIEIASSDIIIFDDRQKVVNMWRSLGLTCCQVAPGNF